MRPVWRTRSSATSSHARRGWSSCGSRARRFLRVGCRVAVLVAAEVASAAEPRSLDELLELGLTGLLEVEVVTPSKVPQKLHDVAQTVRVITAQQIAERGYLTLEEALADLPGFQFRNILGFNSYVFMRGAPSQNNLILLLVDGVQVNELNSGGFYGGSQHDLSNVERIEVVFGPASVPYGTNAVSGVVNLVTRTPATGQGGSASALYGRFETFASHLRYGSYDEGRRLGFLLSGMFVETDKADLAGAAGDDNWTDRMDNFERDLAFSARLTAGELSASLLVEDKNASRTTNYRTVGDQYQDWGTSWHISFVNASVRHVHDWSSSTELASHLYYRNSTVEDDTIAYIDSSSQVGYYRPAWLLGLESILSLTPSPRLSLVLGAVVERASLATDFSTTSSDSPDQRPPPPPAPEMEDNTLFSTHAQARFRLAPQLLVTAAARYDSSSVYSSVLTPSLALAFNRERLAVKLNYAEAFREPRPWDSTDGIGNPDLEPEKMESLELAASWDISRQVRGTASVYSSSLRGLLTREELGDDWRWVNQGELNTEGAELTLDSNLGRTGLWLNYTYTRSLDDDDRQAAEIARHGANVGLRYAANERFTLSLRGNYLGARRNPRLIAATGDDRIDDAFLTHATLSLRTFKDWEVQLIVKNLFDVRYYHPSNRPPDRYRQPQRTLLLRLVTRF